LTFTFIPCEAGYTAETYLLPCSPCAEGTFKLTSGLYTCQECPKDTYTNSTGTIHCLTCPPRKVSSPKSTSIEDCVCDVGYYINPFNRKECLTCPVGAICAERNLTIPSALPGYWFSLNDISSFYLCNPRESCGGGNAENCTDAYAGIRCGNCKTNNYRSKNKCLACGDTFSTLVKLGILIFVMFFVIIFLFVTSTYYPSLLTSVSITMSFWQVLSIISKYDIKWPWTIETTLTAASTSNFNFDFLATACLFRGVSFVTLWILKMLIPLGLVFGFVLLYGIAELRSLFATFIGNKIVKAFNIKYKQPPIVTQEMSKGEFLKVRIMREVIWVYNVLVWIPRHTSTRRDFKILFNRLLNTLSAYISFLYIFMMSTASEIFVCTPQKNGSYTLNESSDILCFQGDWWFLFPLAFVWYLVFGLGILLYFGLMVIQRKKNLKDELFQLRFRFVLLRFKNKFFYWKIVETFEFFFLIFLKFTFDVDYFVEYFLCPNFCDYPVLGDHFCFFTFAFELRSIQKKIPVFYRIFLTNQ
jgi:hypothetical protein